MTKKNLKGPLSLKPTTVCPVDCIWGEYKKIAECSKSCGGGIQIFERKKIQESKYGGANCTGESKSEKVCNEQPCPINCMWGEFGQWSQCSKTCGRGIQIGKREMIQEAQYGGDNCTGKAVVEKSCTQQLCFVPGKYLHKM